MIITNLPPVSNFKRKTMRHLLTSFLLPAAFLFGYYSGFGQNDPASPHGIPGAESKIYKTVADTTELRLHIFQPTEKSRMPRAAIIFYFGGGWAKGSVNQFVPHSKFLADRGLVAVVADYRVKSRHGVTPFDCVADVKSAMRWLRAHAGEYNIDPQRIVAAGGSAGGHLAASTALVKTYNTPGDDLSISAVPNGLVLFNPVLDMVKFFARRRNNDDEKLKAISPIHHMHKGVPPTLIFHGTDDKTVPIDQVIRFSAEMKKQGNTCELVKFDGRGHGFFNSHKGDGSDYRATLEKMEEFLMTHGFLSKTSE